MVLLIIIINLWVLIMVHVHVHVYICVYIMGVIGSCSCAFKSSYLEHVQIPCNVYICLGTFNYPQTHNCN